MMRLSKAILEKASVELLHKKKKIVLLTLLIWAMGGLANNAYAQEQAKHYQTCPDPHFKPNKGQVVDYKGNQLPGFEYVYQAPGMKLGLKKNGFSYNLYSVEEEPKAAKKISEATGKPVNADQPPDGDKEEEITYHYHRVEVAFKGANEDPKIIAGKQMDYYANYYLGYLPEYVTNVHGYRKLTYKNLYDSIDLVLSTQTTEDGQPKLKYDIVVHPGGDLSEVKMAYKGMESLSVKNGNLQIATSQGKMTETIPKSYWAESKATAKVKYQVEGNVVSFKTHKEKKAKTLIVDPSLKWSTFLGGSDPDEGSDIITDDSGNVYVTGRSESTDFPTTNGAYQQSYGGGNFSGDDAFLTKFTSSGSLSWSTYLGGNNRDEAIGVTSDDSGNVYVTGGAGSGDFPTTSGAYQESYGGNGDAFLSKFTSSGSLSWSTFLGGNGIELGNGLTTDDNGSVYLTGRTGSGDFPTTSGAYQTSYGGLNEAFLSKFTSSGSLSWSTYLGGGERDRASGVTTDDSGNVYVTGGAGSGFPTTNGAYQTSNGGSNDVFISKFTSTGSLSWSTYLGGSADERGNSITTDNSGNVYVTGVAGSGFPTTSGAYQESYGGGSTLGANTFISKFSSSGSLSWSTYLSGSNGDQGSSVTTDGSGNIYMTGVAQSGFPTTSGAYQPSNGGSADAFISRFTRRGNLSWSTYLGGFKSNRGSGVTTDDSGNLYVTGKTESGDFPTTSGAYQSFSAGRDDVFLSKFNPPQKPNAGFVSDSGCVGDTLQFVDTSFIRGNDTITRYNWHFGDGNSASGKSVSHVYDTGGTYQVELIITTNKGGRDAITQPVTVNPAPQVAFEIDTGLCIGDSLSFTNNTQFKGPPDSLTYTWSLGNGDTLRTREPEYAYETAGEITVEFTATSKQGCSSSKSRNVQVGDTVSSAFSFGGDTSVCVGDTLSFINNTQFGGSLDSLTYTWSLGNSDTLMTREPEYAYETAGEFKVELTATSEQGCSSSESRNLEIGDTVSSAFTFEKVNNETVSFDAASEDALRYNWDFGDGVQSDSINPIHTYDSNRKYQVTLTVLSSDGCATTSTNSLELKFVGIDQNGGSKESNFSAFPNPFEQTINVDYTLNEGSTVRLEVFDADGRRVAVPLQNTQQIPGEYTYQLNLEDAKKSAFYFLRVTIDGKTHVKRIFKAK